jgi:hypothetical protein
MAKFRYIVINQENKQLNGSISASDETSARKELNELGFSIISMTQMSESEASESSQEGVSFPTFEFGAIDKNQKHIIGTIQSEDRLAAYKRLISEYSFHVEYVIDNNLGEADKEKERVKGAYDLEDKVTEEAELSKKKVTNEEKDLKEFEMLQSVLQTQINFVLGKVKIMLDTYEKVMKPETKEKIRFHVDKIVRIKSSTNLDYIRKCTEDLLSFLQKEELFLQEDIQLKERTQLLVEAKGMMMQLKQSRSKKSINLSDLLRGWQIQHIKSKENPHILEKAASFFIGIVAGTNLENPDIILAKKEISIQNDQILQYIKLYFQAPTPDFKNETKKIIIKLLKERKDLKQKLHQLKHGLKVEKINAGEDLGMTKFYKELITFSGWLLFFYLIYYFSSIYISTKNLGLPDIPFIFNIYQSSFLKYFLVTLFLFHGSLSLKINFFKNNQLATLIIAPVFFMSVLIFSLNL